MGKEHQDSISNFICYNCNVKNYFDKMNYLDKNELETASEIQSGGNRIKEVMIECKSCRESNTVTFEY